jgi:O-antigen/teichoic acid export membrane protein
VIIGGHVVDDLKRSKFDKNLFKQMIHYSSPLILNSISWWIIQSSDKIMVELMISASALGLYSVATKIPSLINVIITIFTQAWGISSIKEVESSNDTKFFSNVFSIYSFLTFGAAIVLIAIIKPFMNIYVGSQFKEAWVFVPLLLMSAIFSSISAYYGALFAALKKSLSNMTSTLIAAVANIIINFIGIKIIGIWGAVIGTVFAYILVAIIRMHGVHKELNIQIDLTKIIMNIAISLTMAILVSIDFYRVVVSIIALSLFVIINIDQIKFLADKSKRIIRRSRVRKEIDSECVDDNELQ